MTFFYDLNKRLADLAKKQNLTEGAKPDFLDLDKDGNKTEPMKKAAKEVDEASYSAKAARAGKDIGKPGKTFAKIAKSAGERYGSKERGEKVAGAVLAKLRAKESVDEADDHKEMKLIRDLRAKGLSDKEIRKEIEKIKSGTSKHMPKESSMDENALQAYLGKKKYGETGMKALQKAGREDASKATMAKIRARHDKMDEADMDEGNEFSGALAKAKATGAKEFEVDGKKYKVTAEEKASRSTGTAFDRDYMKQQMAKKDAESHSRYDVKDTGYSKRYTRKPEPEVDEPEVSDQPKKKGRPKGPAKGPERVTKGAWKHKGARKTAEDLDTDGVMMTKPSNMSSEDRDPLVDRGEFGREGDMAKEQLKTIDAAAEELMSILGDEQDLPEWVQKKITLAMDYIDTARDYMLNQDNKEIAEKAVSKKQQKFMGMVHAAQKGEKPASKEVAKVAKEMPKKAAKDFAATKHKGLPEKVKAKKEESVEETSETPKEKKSSGGFQFGKGVYESMNKKVENAIMEGMNVSVNMSTGEDGQARKNITVSADGDDADKLAELLKMAGLEQHSHSDVCPTCGEEPCGCESLDENSPDWPTNTETSDDALQYSGGLNKPKSTGQTTVPVIASQLRRQVSMEEGVELERSLFKLYQAYKTK